MKRRVRRPAVQYRGMYAAMTRWARVHHCLAGDGYPTPCVCAICAAWARLRPMRGGATKRWVQCGDEDFMVEVEDDDVCLEGETLEDDDDQLEVLPHGCYECGDYPCVCAQRTVVNLAVLRVRPGRVAYYRNGRLPALTEAELRAEMQQEQEIVGM